MEKRKSALALTVVFLSVAGIVALLYIAAFCGPSKPEAPAPSPGATSSPWSETYQERYLDEAWQQFSH